MKNCFVLVTKYVLLFLLLVLAGLPGKGQQRVMRLPVAYERPRRVLPQAGTLINDQAWVVWSDRDSNPTFTDAKAVQPKKVMAYMDAFFVVDEKGDYLHLYSYTGFAGGEGKKLTLPAGAEDFGWAKKDNLLLWHHCLLTDSGISRKAMPILNEKVLTGSVTNYMSDSARTLLLYHGPGLVNADSRQAKMFQFLFIYKDDSASVLLGTALRTNSSSIKTDILGWVSKDIITEWDGRVCLQPNTVADAVAERKNAGIKALVFANKQQANSWKSTADTVGKIWDKDYYSSKAGSFSNRFPVLSSDSGVYSVGAFTNIIGNTGAPLVEGQTLQGLQAAFEKTRASLCTRNIVFVVEGGQAYTEYASKLCDVLRSAAARAEELRGDASTIAEQNNITTYGAVVYRDYGDSGCPDIEKALDKFIPSANTAELVDWLQKHAQEPGCAHGKKAVMGAIAKALGMFLGNRGLGENNLIIVIGGETGAANAAYPDTSIARKLARAGVNLLAIQVAHTGGHWYDDFTVRLKKLVSTACRYRYEEDRRITKARYTTGGELRLQNVSDSTWKLEYTGASPQYGEVWYVKKGHKIRPESFELRITGQLEAVEKEVASKLGNLTQLFETDIEKYKIVDTAVVAYMASQGLNFDQNDVLEKYRYSGYQFFLKGYTSDSVKGLIKPVFSRSIFICDDELRDFSQSFESLKVEETKEKIRETLLGVYHTIVNQYIDEPGMKEKAAKGDITFGEINWLLTGVKSNNSLLDIKLADFAKKSVIPDETVVDIRKYLLEKLQQLNEASHAPGNAIRYEYGSFYCIDEKMFP